MRTWTDVRRSVGAEARAVYVLTVLLESATVTEAARKAGMDASAFRRLCRGAKIVPREHLGYTFGRVPLAGRPGSVGASEIAHARETASAAETQATRMSTGSAPQSASLSPGNASTNAR